MDEWTVVTALVVLIGLGGAVMKPMMSLNSTITRLTEAVRVLEKNIEGFSAENAGEHGRLRDKAGEQEKILQNHELRLGRIENK